MRPPLAPMRAGDPVGGKGQGAQMGLSAEEVYARLLSFREVVEGTNGEIKGMRADIARLEERADETNEKLGRIQERLEYANTLQRKNHKAIGRMTASAEKLYENGSALGKMLWERLKQGGPV